MKDLTLKKDIEETQSSDDIWYDLLDGGYIDPKNYLIPEDAQKVQQAMDLLVQFKDLLEENELIGEM